ncbi:MAG TPA: hypothetical protein VIS57_07500, partial [Xanthomonadales bacterium]
ACSQNGGTTSTPETDVSGGREVPMTISANKVQVSGVSLEQQVAGALTDLVERTGFAKGSIKVSQARTVTWGSSAVGCPKDGMSYTQAIVPGVLVILDADGTVYRYHGRMNSKLFFCPVDRAQEPAYGPGEEFM